MKIPIFEEIILKGHSSTEIHASLEDSRIGKVPAYINLHQVKNDDLETLVMNLEQVILEIQAHPRFPYPLFLITRKSLHSLIPTVRTVSELPEHYFRKVKRPNNKELQLLNKLSLKVDKIKNLELYKVMEKFKESAEAQKKLYQETKELFFLEAIHAKLNPVAKPKTKGHS
jgi:hypothetical protein